MGIDIPDPQSDESFYSLCARLRDRLRFPQEYTVLERVFGERYIKAASDFPDRIQYVADQCFIQNGYTTDYLINYHTPFRFYSPFLSPEKAHSLRDQIKYKRQENIHRQLGLIGGNITQRRYLRYCPKCVVEERRILGFCYWHRNHQLPGVEVCCFHRVWLNDSQVPSQGLHKFVSAEVAVSSLAVRNVDFENEAHCHIFAIAESAVWLLDQVGLTSDPQAIRQRYLSILAEQEFASYTGSLYAAKLSSAFAKYYSPTLLETLNSSLEEDNNRNWLTRITQVNHFVHPARHLLLIHFLGHSAKSFFALPGEAVAFGNGPWPCLNPVCKDYGKFVIYDLVLGHTRRSRRKPLGTFTCQCGFVYCRVGPDTQPTDKFRIGKIKRYGSVWEAQFRSLWSAPDTNINQIAHEMDCSWITIERQARRLGLTSAEPMVEENRTSYDVPTPHMLLKYRQEWLDALIKYPSLGTARLQAAIPNVYSWLDRHDSAWLNLNKPRRRSFQRRQANWEARDNDLVTKIATSVDVLRNMRERPVRITKQVIAMELGIPKNWVERDLNKLPRTAREIARFEESPEQFALRRLHSAMQNCLKCQEEISRSELIKMAGISKRMEVKCRELIEQVITNWLMISE